MTQRALAKGGIWKNTEDEILKAAVMKYGKNQWSRISSLLVRKTAKQCKARWYEWLDPSIKKTEWTRQEEEKLLHLAKIMPTQWKTIAQCLEGRTGAQCLAHYEKLLDAAQAKQGEETGEDARKLRPGEIDPQPETKPARPDPVDMDEDEKEMLSEARARLANTKGKKAKRKAREKMLDEARRLAALQKRREMKAAGIDIPVFIGRRGKKRRDIDFSSEIPFEKTPAPGFYDTSEEKGKRYKTDAFIPVDLQRLEGPAKAEEEKRRRKEDRQKNKEMAKEDLPEYLRKINELNRSQTILRKVGLDLPAPQIVEGDLAAIAKMAGTVSGEGATSALLSSYESTPGLTPRMVQRTPARRDTVMMEAHNLLALSSSQTPLKGGDNAPLNPSDFSGGMPKPSEVVTPNILKTPLRTASGAPMRTPVSTPLPTTTSTPFRDNLQINRGLREERKLSAVDSLKQKLSALPEPQFEYEIQLPAFAGELPEKPKDDDQGDLDEQRRLLHERAVSKERANRSEVIKRGMSRPSSLPTGFSLGVREGDPHAPVLRLIEEEMLHLLRYEQRAFPLGPKEKPVHDPSFYKFEESELKRADELIEEEMRKMEIDEEMVANVLGEVAFDIAFDSKGQVVQLSSLDEQEKAEILLSEFHVYKAEVAKQAKKATSLDKKLQVLHGGYMKKAEQMVAEIQALREKVEKSSMELSCYEALQQQERQAAPLRKEKLTAEVEMVEQRERELQARYASLRAKKEKLHKLLEPTI